MQSPPAQRERDEHEDQDRDKKAAAHHDRKRVGPCFRIDDEDGGQGDKQRRAKAQP